VAGISRFVVRRISQLSDQTWVVYNVEAMARTDVQLMLDVKAGDEQSFELLLRKYRTPLVNFLYRMVRDTAAAEDLAQEVFLRVYRAREEYAPSAKFTTWMFRIATNLALNSLRDNRHRRADVSIDQTVDMGDEEQQPMDVADRKPSIEQELVARSRAEIIVRAVHALPEKQRAAVLLHKYQELDYDEISKILGCSESALKSILFRAYETLRGQLASLVITGSASTDGVRSGSMAGK
jgi:RNA polymerase sigma-70 factor, ECF subfamily